MWFFIMVLVFKVQKYVGILLIAVVHRLIHYFFSSLNDKWCVLSSPEISMGHEFTYQTCSWTGKRETLHSIFCYGFTKIIFFFVSCFILIDFNCCLNVVIGKSKFSLQIFLFIFYINKTNSLQTDPLVLNLLPLQTHLRCLQHKSQMIIYHLKAWGLDEEG